MRRLIAMCTLAIAAAPVPASAAVPVIYETQGTAVFRFAVPDNWSLRTGQSTPASAMPAGQDPAPRVVSIVPQDGAEGMWAGLWSPPGISGLDDGLAYVKSLDARLLDTPTVTATRDLSLAGGPARLISGTGSRLGVPVVFDVAVIPLANGRVAIATFIGSREKRSALDADLSATLASITAEGAR